MREIIRIRPGWVSDGISAQHMDGTYPAIGWSTVRKMRVPSMIGGGHLDPHECDRFETVLQRTLKADPAAAVQWRRSFKPRAR